MAVVTGDTENDYYDDNNSSSSNVMIIIGTELNLLCHRHTYINISTLCQNFLSVNVDKRTDSSV